MDKTAIYTDDLLEFLNRSVVNFFVVDTVRRRLEQEGFLHLEARDHWDLQSGGRYYLTQNDTAIFAFIVGESDPTRGFRIISAHTDSPGFRVKPSAEILCPGNVVKLNTEVYGGPILYTWFNRPLSIAGRVLLRSSDPFRPVTRLVKFDRPLLTIPHLAIHFNRSVNEGNPLSKQKDMLPVLGIIDDGIKADGMLCRMVAQQLGVDPDDILDFDLSLFDTTPATLEGVDREFISSGRLDDLGMAHAAMTALIESENTEVTRIIALFDNEETGSGTKQGAASPILADAMRRIVYSLGGDEETYLRAVADSFMVSADNAHATHPNYVEKQDPTNHPVLGGGPVIKINANCKYMTDADSAAVFRSICERAEVPYQYFVNHSDVAGGSTLGNILTSQVPLRGVDMGAGIWSMHSVRETASVDDHTFIIRAFIEFFSC